MARSRKGAKEPQRFVLADLDFSHPNGWVSREQIIHQCRVQTLIALTTKGRLSNNIARPGADIWYKVECMTGAVRLFKILFQDLGTSDEVFGSLFGPNSPVWLLCDDAKLLRTDGGFPPPLSALDLDLIRAAVDRFNEEHR